MATCKIDVKGKVLIFDVEKVYYTEVKLDYEVEEEKAQAKFDRRRKEMRIVLPIVQLPEVVMEIAPDLPLEEDSDEEVPEKGSRGIENTIEKQSAEFENVEKPSLQQGDDKKDIENCVEKINTHEFTENLHENSELKESNEVNPSPRIEEIHTSTRMPDEETSKSQDEPEESFSQSINPDMSGKTGTENSSTTENTIEKASQVPCSLNLQSNFLYELF